MVHREVRAFLAQADGPILDALAKISANKSGIVFCVEASGRLVGVLTDGDFRRWVVDQPVLDMHRPVADIANRDFTAAAIDADQAQVEALFSERVTIVPLLDDAGRVVAVATAREQGVYLDGRLIDDAAPALLVAEIGINHNGRVDLALDLVDAAADAGADCAKFQMRHLPALYRNEGRAIPAGEDLGAEYTLDLLNRFTLTTDEMFGCFDRCRERGLIPLCTPWDHESLGVLEGYGLPGYKVASADLTNHELLEAVATTRRPVLASTGMSTEAEIAEAVTVLQRHRAAYVLLHCNSTYPAPFKDVHLRYLARLREIGRCPVGYSGHERGWAVPVAAVALGAKVIEKHLTVDRSMEGNDHRISLLPAEFRAMAEAVRSVEASLGTDRRRVLTQGEMMNRVTLAKSLVAARDLAAGEEITADAVAIKSPGRGLQPNRRADLVGRRAKRALATGAFFYPSDLTEGLVEPRPYSFRRPWGLPVRYHDLHRLTSRATPDFVEFHLSYHDLDTDPGQFLDDPLDLDLAVHSPDLFRGDHLLNLAAEDPAYRRRSITELQRVIDLTRRLSAWFPRAGRPIVIVSMGGFSDHGPLPETVRPELYERVAASLDELDDDGVEIVAQTLPPFPWYLGGQLHCNLFVDPADTAAFAAGTGRRLCFDASHSKLAANHRGTPFSELVEEIGPHVAHLHLVDAEGSDGEGLQIGDGGIDFAVLAEQLDRLAPTAGFIPEIWQGHKNDGEGFWVALDRLEQWF